MSTAEQDQAEAQADPTHKDFLRKHVRGIPREKMKDQRVYYGFRYRDLRDFINALISQYKNLENPELLSRLSELEVQLQALKGERDAMAAQIEEAMAKPDPSALQDLQDTITSLEEAKTLLETTLASTEEERDNLLLDKGVNDAKISQMEEQLSGSADEQTRRIQELTAELATLKETFDKLEQENEFLDGEVQKLDGSNKDLLEKIRLLEEELARLKADLERQSAAFNKERADFQDKVEELQKLVAASRDAQKLADLQKRYAEYKDVLDAYEAAAAEAVDIEARPDFPALEAEIAAVRERAPEGSAAASLAAALETGLQANEAAVAELLETMYQGQGSFRVILNLGKALVRTQLIADQVRMLDLVTREQG